MNLPVTLDPAPDALPLLKVDGSWDAPGLELSHWPGNRTPRDLRHELSTGSALLFARLPAAERERRAAGAVAIANNHYDTDGVLALFAAARPREALARERALLDAAAAGDFFRAPSERAVALDALVSALADPERSPLPLAGLDDAARHAACLEHLFERLPALLDGALDPWRALWEPEVLRLRADLSDLSAAARTNVVAAHLVAHVARAPWPAGGPGRHALFARGEADRVLASAPHAEGGFGHRLVIGTGSWFDLDVRGPARPDLDALRAALNELEGADPAGERAWRCQDAASPSPELWFGAAEHARFDEHCPALRGSGLAPERVLEVVARYLSSPA